MVFLSIFCQFQPGVAYKSVAYKKVSKYEIINRKFNSENEFNC